MTVPSRIIELPDKNKVDIVKLGALDPENLAPTYRTLGSEVAYYGSLRDDLAHRRSQLSDKLENLQARLLIEKKVALKDINNGKGPTVDELKAHVRNTAEFQATSAQLMDSEYRFNQLGTVMKALSAKQECLVSAAADRRQEHRSTSS